MDLHEIRKIVELMNEHGLTHFDLTKKDFHLKLKKGADLEELKSLLAVLPSGVGVASPMVAAAPAPVAAAAPASAAAPAAAPVATGSEITSPMVGTFYRRPAPDAAAFVEVGTNVSVGQVICIIEAMKVMNEIKAEKSGVISAVLVEEGAPVQYGDALFAIQ